MLAGAMLVLTTRTRHRGDADGGYSTQSKEPRQGWASGSALLSSPTTSTHSFWGPEQQRQQCNELKYTSQHLRETSKRNQCGERGLTHDANYEDVMSVVSACVGSVAVGQVHRWDISGICMCWLSCIICPKVLDKISNGRHRREEGMSVVDRKRSKTRTCTYHSDFQVLAISL
jgi:hypothetical protein